MNSPAVVIQNLVKKYGDFTALHGISLEINHGEVFGLLGPNGAGKTTTLECLEGLRIPTSGKMLVDGVNPSTGGALLRRKLGVQLQSSSLPDAITAREAMELICAWGGKSTRSDLLSHFGLNELANQQYHSLSTGQKRRVHLALALAQDPPVVILDEPTAGLDVQGRAQLHNAIRDLKSKGVTILIATHDMAEAENLCDRIAIIIRGRIATIGSPAQITAAGNLETRITLRTSQRTLLTNVTRPASRFIGETDGYGTWLSTDAAITVMDLLKDVQKTGDRVEDLRVERPSLEERFLELLEGDEGQ